MKALDSSTQTSVLPMQIFRLLVSCNFPGCIIPVTALNQICDVEFSSTNFRLSASENLYYCPAKQRAYYSRHANCKMPEYGFASIGKVYCNVFSPKVIIKGELGLWGKGEGVTSDCSMCRSKARNQMSPPLCSKISQLPYQEHISLYIS